MGNNVQKIEIVRRVSFVIQGWECVFLVRKTFLFLWGDGCSNIAQVAIEMMIVFGTMKNVTYLIANAKRLATTIAIANLSTKLVTLKRNYVWMVRYKNI